MLIKKFISLAVLILWCSLPGFSQIGPETEIDSVFITEKVWSTFNKSKEIKIQIKNFSGNFNKINFSYSPDNQTSVGYIDSKILPNLTLIVAWSNRYKKIFALDVKPTRNVPISKMEYGDQEAWLPINGDRVLVWPLAFKSAMIVDCNVLYNRFKSDTAVEIFQNVDLTDPNIQKLLLPIKIVPKNDQTDEFELQWAQRRLVMNRSPRAFWMTLRKR